MSWLDAELIVKHLNGKISYTKSDALALHFVCTCEARLDIPRNGPPLYLPGTIMDVTGGFLIECPECGTMFSWKNLRPECLVEFAIKDTKD